MCIRDSSRIGRSGKRLTADLKLLDDLSSNPEDVGLRGTRIAFGNTKPGIEAQVEKDYAFAAAQGCDVLLLLFSTFGGFNVGVTRLIGKAAAQVRDKLSHAQHLDEASWSTRSWTTKMCQRLSVVLHTACAWEIQQELCRAA